MEPSNSYPSTMPHGADNTAGTTTDAARQNFQRYYGAHARAAGPVALPPPSMWSRVPAAIWAALVVGGLGFVVSISIQETRVGSDGYSCSYADLGAFVAAGLIVALTVLGWSRRAWTAAHARLPLPIMSALTVLLVVLAFVHVLRGSGTIMSPCDAMPVP